MGGPVSRRVRALGCWGAGPLTAVVAGVGAFQSSIHSGAVAGPGCRAGLGGSIKTAAVRVVEARHRNELARACAAGAGPGAQPSARRSASGGHDFHRARPVRGVEATDLAVAQAVEAEREDLARDGDLGALAAAATGRPRRWAIRSKLSPSGPSPWVFLWAASISAHRNAPEPSRLMCPSRALASELRTVGVRPAHAQRCRAEGKRSIAPISAMISSAR